MLHSSVNMEEVKDFVHVSKVVCMPSSVVTCENVTECMEHANGLHA